MKFIGCFPDYSRMLRAQGGGPIGKEDELSLESKNAVIYGG